MTGAVVGQAVSAVAQGACEFPRVLEGTVLDGSAARLAAILNPAFLTEVGWDPRTQVLSLPAQHPLLGRMLCRVEGCMATAHGTKIGGCAGGVLPASRGRA
jgi:hypothetical protein